MMAVTSGLIDMLKGLVASYYYVCSCGYIVSLDFRQTGPGAKADPGAYAVRLTHPKSRLDHIYFYNDDTEVSVVVNAVLDTLRTMGGRGYLCESPTEIEWVKL